MLNNLSAGYLHLFPYFEEHPLRPRFIPVSDAVVKVLYKVVPFF